MRFSQKVSLYFLFWGEEEGAVDTCIIFCGAWFSLDFLGELTVFFLGGGGSGVLRSGNDYL